MKPETSVSTLVLSDLKNAVVLQVRPEGDALYQSRLEPWKRAIIQMSWRIPAAAAAT